MLRHWSERQWRAVRSRTRRRRRGSGSSNRGSTPPAQPVPGPAQPDPGDELNAMLAERVVSHAKAARHPEFRDRTIREVFQEEKAALVALQSPFKAFHETTVAVSNLER